jgi:hypothetical protein
MSYIDKEKNKEYNHNYYMRTKDSRKLIKKEYWQQYYKDNKTIIKEKRNAYYDENRDKINLAKRAYYEDNKAEIIKFNKGYRNANKDKSLYQKAKVRAKRNSLEFNILLEDIIIPQFCPYIEIELDKTVNKLQDNSISLDRINNELGYIKSNIMVVSHKANAMKSNLTFMEIESINNNYDIIPYKNEAVKYDIMKNIYSARQRAKKYNVEFSITKNDIILTKRCPLLNIELNNSLNKAAFNSPTLDRLDNSKGYVPGNIRVISFKANTSKSSSTKEEYNLLTNNLKKVIENSKQ